MSYMEHYDPQEEWAKKLALKATNYLKRDQRATLSTQKKLNQHLEKDTDK